MVDLFIAPARARLRRICISKSA